jgi:peptidoglycan/LPS O-acetylase OafA/YrhL
MKFFISSISLLRVISLLFVVFFHLKVPGFTYGYLGVDAFIIISGYLIGSGEYLNRKDFVDRRVKALAPDYFKVSLIILLLGVVFLDSNQFLITIFTIILTPIGASHIFLSNQIGYFGLDALSVPALHYWSLSAEILNYIFFYLVIIEKNIIFRNIYLVTYLIFIYVFDLFVEDSYFCQSLRILEFTVGILWAKKKTKDVNHTLLIAAFGSAMIYGCRTDFITLTEKTIFILAVLLIGEILKNLFELLRNEKILKTINFLSSRVYRTYLLHYPIISFETLYLLNNHINIKEVLILLLVLIIFLFLFERVSVFIPTKYAFALMAVLSMTGYFSADYRYYNASHLENVKNGGISDIKLLQSYRFSNSSCVSVVGDSHARQLSFLLKNAGINVYYNKVELSDLVEWFNSDYAKNSYSCKKLVTYRWIGEAEKDIFTLKNYSFKDVTFVQDLPSFSIDPRYCIQSQLNRFFPGKCDINVSPTISRSYLVDDIKNWNMVKKIADSGTFIELYEKLCTHNECITSINGKFIYRDKNHISETISYYDSKFILNLFGILNGQTI